MAVLCPVGGLLPGGNVAAHRVVERTRSPVEAGAVAPQVGDVARQAPACLARPVAAHVGLQDHALEAGTLRRAAAKGSHLPRGSGSCVEPLESPGELVPHGGFMPAATAHPGDPIRLDFPWPFIIRWLEHGAPVIRNRALLQGRGTAAVHRVPPPLKVLTGRGLPARSRGRFYLAFLPLPVSDLTSGPTQ